MAKTACPVFYAFNTDGLCVAVRCGKWLCKDCAKINAAKWAIRARKHIDAADGLPFYFVTLTLGSRYRAVYKAYEELPKLWNRVRMWVKRAIPSGEEWEYLAFVEGQRHRGGMPHFHIICSHSIAGLATGKNGMALRKMYGKRKKIRIKDWAVARGFGFEAEESVVTGNKAAFYVTKYASKGDPFIPPNFRRCRASHNWLKLPDYDGAELIVRTKTETLSEYLFRVCNITGMTMEQLLEAWNENVNRERDNSDVD